MDFAVADSVIEPEVHLTIPEAAEQMGVSLRTVYDRISKAEITAVKTPAGLRIHRRSIEGLRRHRAPKTPRVPETRSYSIVIRQHGARGHGHSPKKSMRRRDWEQDLRRAAEQLPEMRPALLSAADSLSKIVLAPQGSRSKSDDTTATAI